MGKFFIYIEAKKCYVPMCLEFSHVHSNRQKCSQKHCIVLNLARESKIFLGRTLHFVNQTCLGHQIQNLQWHNIILFLKC